MASKVVRVVKRESLWPKITSWFGFGSLESVDGKERIPVKDIRLPHGVEAATGDYKLYLLAFEQGYLDPYCTLPIGREGKGDCKENPIEIPSFETKRFVGCQCEEHTSFTRYTTVYKGELKRCQCGYWMKCVDAPKFWEDIPEEELMSIPKYRRMLELQKLGVEARW